MFSDPKKNIKQFGIREGDIVVDLGSGTGVYSLLAVSLVGHHGKVYAIDINRDLIARTKKEAIDAEMKNLEILWGDVEKHLGTKLAENTAHKAIVSNLLFQIEDKAVFLKELKRILKPEGQVLVVDWLESFGGIGPKPVHVVSKDRARSYFENNGFTFEREIVAGDHHYGIIYKYV